jgi:hypothetical protein
VNSLLEGASPDYNIASILLRIFHVASLGLLELEERRGKKQRYY